MPLCICKDKKLPSFENREPLRGKTPDIKGEYVIHQECRKCGGFRVFIWDSEGKKQGAKTHEEYLRYAREWNEKRMRERSPPS